MKTFNKNTSYSHYFSNTKLLTVLDQVEDGYMVYWLKLGRREVISQNKMEYYAKYEYVEELNPAPFDAFVVKDPLTLLEDVNFFFRDEDAFTWAELVLVIQENNYHNDFYKFFNNELKIDNFSVIETLTAQCSLKYHRHIYVG